MAAPPSVIDASVTNLACCGFMKRKISVFSSLILSMLLGIHAVTSARQLFSWLWTRRWSETDFGLNSPYICMLSAYLWYLSLCRCTICSSGVVYMLKTTGPKTDPWGTPQLGVWGSDLWSPTFTQMWRPAKGCSRNYPGGVGRRHFFVLWGGGCFVDVSEGWGLTCPGGQGVFYL